LIDIFFIDSKIGNDPVLRTRSLRTSLHFVQINR